MKTGLHFAQKTTVLLVFALGMSGTSVGQGPKWGDHMYSVCEYFDGEGWNPFEFFFSPDSTWQIGQPSKTGFDTSYSGSFSVVTSLDTHYKNSDTAVFVVQHTNTYFYVFDDSYAYVGVEFYHRFKTDSTNDYGTLHLSMDSGQHWLDLFSTEGNDSNVYTGFAQNHDFLGLDSSSHDTLLVHGNSNGWVRSRIFKKFSFPSVSDIFLPGDLLLRFAFISDSVGTDAGWQIDDLCVGIEGPSGIDEVATSAMRLWPNPTTGSFRIETPAGGWNDLKVTDSRGCEVPYTITGGNEVRLVRPTSGVYFVHVRSLHTTLSTKLIILTP